MSKKDILNEFMKTFGVVNEDEALKQCQKMMHDYKDMEKKLDATSKALSETSLDAKRREHEIDLIMGMRRSGVLSRYSDSEFNQIVSDVNTGIKNIDDVTSELFNIPKPMRVNPKLSEAPISKHLSIM